MKNFLKIILIALLLAISNNTQINCPIYGHVCDDKCVYIDGICQHEGNYSIDLLENWQPWD